MTKKSNTVELVSGFGKIKSCGNLHGSRSDNHTPLRGEQQATIYDWLRCEERNLW